jgi:hypothetical protein
VRPPVALNDRGVRTARGGAWHDSTVRNLLAGGLSALESSPEAFCEALGLSIFPQPSQVPFLGRLGAGHPSLNHWLALHVWIGGAVLAISPSS